MNFYNEHEVPPSPDTPGIVDLMTSLTITFILLFAALITRTSSVAQTRLLEDKANVQAALSDHLAQTGFSLNSGPRDPLTLLIIIPENRLNFESANAQ